MSPPLLSLSGHVPVSDGHSYPGLPRVCYQGAGPGGLQHHPLHRRHAHRRRHCARLPRVRGPTSGSSSCCPSTAQSPLNLLGFLYLSFHRVVYQDGLYGADVYVRKTPRTVSLPRTWLAVTMWMFSFVCLLRVPILQLIEWPNLHPLPRQPTVMGRRTRQHVQYWEGKKMFYYFWKMVVKVT